MHIIQHKEQRQDKQVNTQEAGFDCGLHVLSQLHKPQDLTVNTSKYMSSYTSARIRTTWDNEDHKQSHRVLGSAASGRSHVRVHIRVILPECGITSHEITQVSESTHT